VLHTTDRLCHGAYQTPNKKKLPMGVRFDVGEHSLMVYLVGSSVLI
jgi:hypothetical protein